MKHRDPGYIKRYLQSPEGAGRNVLSILCCDYYMIKLIAEPFLNTTRGVQDIVDNTTECVQASRNRISCADFLSSTQLMQLPTEGDDLETGSLSQLNEKFGDKEKKVKTQMLYCSSKYFQTYLSWICSPFSYVSTPRIMHVVSVLCAIAIVATFIYASFTV